MKSSTRRTAWGFGAAALGFVTFYISGEPIFQRGLPATLAFVSCAALAAIAMIFHDMAEVERPSREPKPCTDGHEIEGLKEMKDLQAKVTKIENQVNGLAFVMGRYSRRGPTMPETDAPESPR